MRVLLVTPPMTQLNTPYPATAYLRGYLETLKDIEVVQVDASLELALRIFSSSWLKKADAFLRSKGGARKTKIQSDLGPYIEVIDPVIAFLQGKDPSLAYRIVTRKFLPEGPSFSDLGLPDEPLGGEFLGWAFGSLGLQDKAKLLASRLLADVAAIIRDQIDSRFELAKYGEKLASSQKDFGPLLESLNNPRPTLLDLEIDSLAEEIFLKNQPDIVGFTAPFPGNVYGALRMGGKIKLLVQQSQKSVTIILGGGYPNTELRSLSEPRVFEFVDFVSLDDGEKPFELFIDFVKSGSKNPKQKLHRAFFRTQNPNENLVNGKVEWATNPRAHDIPQKSLPAPSYKGLRLGDYLSILDTPNPMHRMWSDVRWNKLTLAHGCYWKKCTFCDVSLDYIGRYETEAAENLVKKIQSLIAQTGSTGFHFVDEAAPPAVLRELSLALLKSQTHITWWTNIRFEKSFTPELCDLMARAGCVAVSGGLEVASDRLLKLMKKGVTVEQVARVTDAFSQAGVMVHAYLMYGFPTQTLQESVDALERVRQLFQHGCIQSAYWHRFGASAHAPIGMNPADYGIKLENKPQGKFAHNDLDFVDPTGCDHDWVGRALKVSLYNFMQGAGLEEDVRSWFEPRKNQSVPKPKVPKNLIASFLG